MFPLSFVTLGLATIGAYAKPMARAAASLEISLSTPADKVASASELRVVATVKNVGDENLKVVKFGTVLDNEHPTRSFIVTKDGNEVPFIGVETSVPADNLSESYWVVIPVGGNVSSEHDVSAAYDFSAAGAGNFTFDPVLRFEAVGLDEPVEAKTAHSVSITVTDDDDDDDVLKRELNLEKRVTFECNDKGKLDAIMSSFYRARALANAAALYIRKKGDGDGLYRDYFRNNPAQDVIKNFDTIAIDNPALRTLSCTHCGFGGFISVKDDNTIYYCGDFFGGLKPFADRFCQTAPDITPGITTLNALTVVTLHTQSYITDCSQAKTSDHRQMENTDSYVCFAAEVYQKNGCNFYNGESR